MTRAYLWQCPVTRNTAAVLAHSESHARRWVAANTRPKVPWTFCGVDSSSRSGVEYTPVVAVLDATGKRRTIGATS